MLCHRCLVVEQSNYGGSDEDSVVGGTSVGPAVTIHNGEALCSKHWQDVFISERRSVEA